VRERQSAKHKTPRLLPKNEKKAKSKLRSLPARRPLHEKKGKAWKTKRRFCFVVEHKKRQKSVPTSSFFSRVDIVFIIIVDFLFFSRLLLPALLPRV